MGYFSELAHEMDEDFEHDQPDPYMEHAEACDHLPKDIWDEVRHLPTAQAVALGDQLLLVKRQQDMNIAIAESIWGKKLGKSPAFFDAQSLY
jgi:hypothetical protein